MGIKRAIKNMSPGFVIKLYKQMQVPKKKRQFAALKSIVENTKEIQELFPEERLQSHFATKVNRNNLFHPDLYINQVRYFRMYAYFKDRYPDMFDPEIKLLDVGDSSGVLLSAMGKKGTSLDINPKNVEQIQAKGLEAYHGSIYDLPFPDKSFDYVMSFQCLEHLEAPLFALKELGRVARRRVFISIPYQNPTTIYPKSYWENLVQLPQEEGGWEVKEIDKDCDYHITEYSSKDFIALSTYTNLTCAFNYPINYFEPLGASTKYKETYFNFFDFKVN